MYDSLIADLLRLLVQFTTQDVIHTLGNLPLS